MSKKRTNDTLKQLFRQILFNPRHAACHTLIIKAYQLSMTEIAGGMEIMPPGSLEEEPQDFNEIVLSWSNKYAMAVKRACY